MSWSAEETETIVEAMRAGATAMSGGSRCHTTYGFREGAFYAEHFDEGDVRESPMSEREVRGLIAGEPEMFRLILRAGPWRRFSRAFLAGRKEEARAALGEALVYGDPLLHGVLLGALLEWPEVAPAPEVAARWRKEMKEVTAYHVLMDAVEWDRGKEMGRALVGFVEKLGEMVGPSVGLRSLRGAFHQQAGDLDAAERDYQAELDAAPPGEWHRQYATDQLARLRALRGRLASL